jgi:hypothetical protein
MQQKARLGGLNSNEQFYDQPLPMQQQQSPVTPMNAASSKVRWRQRTTLPNGRVVCTTNGLVPPRPEKFRLGKLGLLPDRCRVKPWKRLLDWKYILLELALIAASALYAYLINLAMAAGFLHSILKGNDDFSFIWGFSSIAISIFMSKWLWDSVATYLTTRIGTYVRAMYEIEYLIHSIQSGYDYNPNLIENDRITMKDFSETAAFLTKVTQRIFLSDKVRMASPEKMVIQHEQLSESMRDFLDNQFDVTNPTSLCEALSQRLVGIVRMWMDDKRINAGDAFGFAPKYHEIIGETVQDKAQQSFKVYKFVIVGIIFLNMFVLPILMWPRLEIGVVIFFPVVAVTFLSIPAMIVWMGDPFEGDIDHNAFDWMHTEKYVLNLIAHFTHPARYKNVTAVSKSHATRYRRRGGGDFA